MVSLWFTVSLWYMVSLWFMVSIWFMVSLQKLETRTVAPVKWVGAVSGWVDSQPTRSREAKIACHSIEAGKDSLPLDRDRQR